jgi:hypothetical protein
MHGPTPPGVQKPECARERDFKACDNADEPDELKNQYDYVGNIFGNIPARLLQFRFRNEVQRDI